VEKRAPLPGSGTAARRGHGSRWFALLTGTALLALSALTGRAVAQPFDAPTTLFGTRGVIATPSARMAPDGELSVGASFLQNNQHYNLGFQALPWLEASFRYSGLQHFDPDYKVYFDRAFGLKMRLWNEGDWLPAVAVGVDDIIGTGVYNGEYLVASKNFFGDLDTSIGLGWGRRSGAAQITNPLTLVFPSFKNRVSYYGQAGGADFNAFFHGEKVGVFGGVVWHTPLDGLSLLVEYDSDRYAQESATGNFTPRSQVNYGISYALSAETQLGLSWLYGKSVGGNFALRLDPVHSQYPQKIEAPPPAFTARTDEQQRAALAELLARRDPRRAEASRLRQSRNADRNNFIDGLWRLGGDYRDVEVRQGVLDLTVTGTVSETRCTATARLMQGVPTYLTRIRLHDGSGRRSASCAVPHSVEAPLVSAAFLTESDMGPLTPAAFQIDTIDASAGATDGDPQARAKAIRAALTAENIFVMAVSVADSDLTLYYANYHYQVESDALDRIVRVLSKEAPPNVERFRLIAVNAGVPVQEFDVLRSPAERSYQQEDQLLGRALTITPPAMDQPVLADAAADIYPRFTWGLYPQLRQALFDPNRPLGIQFVAAVGGGVELAPGLSLMGSVDVSIFDTFDTGRTSDSLLPHVRSDFLKYFSKGKTGIGDLEANYRFRLTPTLFGRVRTGYLESMFAGAGGEILWRPENARWALGADIYEVWQRDFDRLFGLQHYRQTTGHVSLYYDSPWYNLDFQLRAGQYLAGDRGVTFQITRRFSTGVEIGAFVTKTNVSAAQFGEGSFDKGIIIRIPLGWVAPLETQSQIAMDLRPVQRDGGQTLGGDATLFDETRMTSEGEIFRSAPQMAGR
jgi:hypothetical protein